MEKGIFFIYITAIILHLNVKRQIRSDIKHILVSTHHSRASRISLKSGSTQKPGAHQIFAAQICRGSRECAQAFTLQRDFPLINNTKSKVHGLRLASITRNLSAYPVMWPPWSNSEHHLKVRYCQFISITALKSYIRTLNNPVNGYTHIQPSCFFVFFWALTGFNSLFVHSARKRRSTSRGSRRWISTPRRPSRLTFRRYGAAATESGTFKVSRPRNCSPVY